MGLQVAFPSQKQKRVIINTDAKNESDDQYALVHALLSPSLEIHGVIAAHFGDRIPQSMKASLDEVNLILRLMKIEGRVRVEPGAPHRLPDTSTPVESPGAHLIVEEGMKDDPRPLHVTFWGTLTDMASALLMEPRLNERNVRVIWIGGGDWPQGCPEHNLGQDIHAANLVFASNLEVWQIPMNAYRLMATSYAELEEKVYPCGELGRYLVQQLVERNESYPDYAYQSEESHSLGDSPGVSLILRPDAGRFTDRPAPQFTPEMKYVHPEKYRPIRVYDWVDSRFLFGDFFAKLARFHRSSL